MSPNTFKRFSIYLLLTVLSFMAVDRVAGYALGVLLKQSEFRFSKLYRGGMDVDVLVLGNSRGVNAFYAPAVEQQLDQSVFNLSYNGISMEIGEALLLDYLKHNIPPGKLLLEVTNLGNDNGQLKEQKIYTSFSPSLSKLLSEDYPIIASTCRLSRLYQLNSEMLLRAFYYKNRNDQDWINQGSLNAAAVPYLMETAGPIENILSLEGDGFAALLRILEICDREGISVSLIFSPYLPEFVEHMPELPQWVQTFREALPASASYYDYSTFLQDYSYFADPVHINKAGGLVLIKRMIADGVFE